MQKIFVLYTGGTIGMKPGPDGLVPDAQLAEQALQPYAEQAVFHWHICQPLIDSSNITPQHWAEWLAILQAALPEHDGILVLHGTDTLAYTANFLALALDSGGKPIVLTGAQKPYHATDSDAPALMPRIDGLAIGLFVTPCISAPATAKLAPQRSAARSRGKRSVRTTISCTFSGSYAVNE